MNEQNNQYDNMIAEFVKWVSAQDEEKIVDLHNQYAEHIGRNDLIVITPEGPISSISKYACVERVETVIDDETDKEQLQANVKLYRYFEDLTSPDKEDDEERPPVINIQYVAEWAEHIKHDSFLEFEKNFNSYLEFEKIFN